MIDSTTIVTTQTMIFSLRLSIVYALLFSSIIGLFVLCISSISNKYKKNTEMDHLAQELKDIDRSYVSSSSSSSDFSLEDKD
jgi:ABC-type transport system involved in cytochrome bd biosynthesis fused ATPase/permease subunit